MNKRGIVIAGGGTLGIAEVGALNELRRRDFDFEKLTHFAGASIGSLLATALACRGSIDYIDKVMNELDLEDLKDDSFGIIRDLTRLLKKNGFYKGVALKKLIKKILVDITGDADITFSQIYTRYNSYLVIPVLENYEKTIYYDRFTAGDMPVRKAMRRSAGIPFFYQAIIEKEPQLKMYADGGTLDNYPFHCLEKYLATDQIIGLRLMSSREIYELNHEVETSAPADFCEALIKLIGVMRKLAMKIHEKPEYWANTVKIDIHHMKSTDFKLSEEEKKWLFNQGVLAVTNYFNK